MAWRVYCFSSPPRRLCFWDGETDNRYQPCVCFPKLIPLDLKVFYELYSLRPQELNGLAVGEYFKETERINCSKAIAGD